MASLRELLDAFAAAVAAIEPDLALIEALNVNIRDLESQVAAKKAELLAITVGGNASRAEAERIWREIGEMLGASTPPPAPPPPSPPPPGSSALTLFPTSPVQRWNYNQVYHPIEGQQNWTPDGVGMLFENVVPQATGELKFLLDERNGAAIKWEGEKGLRKTQGHYIVEATIDKVVPGPVYAMLWLYSEGAAEGGHEFDFEYMNGRLEYNLHNGQGGFRMKAVNKDLGGHRVRWEIIRRPQSVIMRATSLTDGWVDELVITPAKVFGWAQAPNAPPNLRFPPDNMPMFPISSMGRSRWPEWSGAWVPQAEKITATLHGYSFTA